MNDKHIIKAIYFDFDGVMTLDKNGTPTIISYISKNTGLPLDLVDAAYRKHNEDLLAGRITHREMWDDFCRSVGMDVDYGILEQSFLDVRLDKRMTELVRRYKNKYLVGMITDNKADRIEAIIENTELKGLFDAVIISGNIRSLKKEEPIFREALKAFGLRADECVFIDNNPKNLIVPEKMGFKTIFFDHAKRDYTEVSSF